MLIAPYTVFTAVVPNDFKLFHDVRFNVHIKGINKSLYHK